MFVLPEALYSPHSSAQNIVFLNDDPVFSGFQFSRVAVTPGSAAQAAAYIQRAINVLIWEDWFFPEAYDVRSLHCSGRTAGAQAVLRGSATMIMVAIMMLIIIMMTRSALCSACSAASGIVVCQCV